MTVQRIVTAVIRDGEVVGGVTPDLRVPWWSLGKTLIAATALALVRDGALGLDDEVRGAAGNLRLLLSHRAGVGDYGSLRAYHDAVAARRTPWTVADVRRRMGSGWTVAEPGSGFHYSNIGYRLVVDEIERVTGDAFPAVAEDLVLAPLGLTGVHFPVGPKDLQSVLDVPSGGYHPKWVLHGLVAGPIGGAARFLDRLIGRALLPPALLREMVAAMPVGEPPPDRPFIDPSYGLGVMVDQQRHVVGHTGGGPGSVIAAYRRPLREAGQSFETIAAFSQGDDVGAVERVAFGLAS